MQDTKRVKNPGKQRKMLFNAPAHIRHKHMAAPLSSTLAEQRGAKTLPVRKGDTVVIKRGDNKGFEGKVSRVDLKAYRIYLEGLTREKVDGTNIFLPIHPSKVEIRSLNLDDKWRKNILQRKQAPETKSKEKATAKAEKKEKPAKTKAQAEEEKAIEEVFEENAAPEAAEEEATVEEPEVTKAPAKKTAAKKAATEEETEAKPRAKRTASDKTEGEE